MTFRAAVVAGRLKAAPRGEVARLLWVRLQPDRQSRAMAGRPLAAQRGIAAP